MLTIVNSALLATDMLYELLTCFTTPALIFVMEIVKIQGATVPKKMSFPEWKPEELALWLDKDEVQLRLVSSSLD
jgi:hypothetical protein